MSEELEGRDLLLGARFKRETDALHLGEPEEGIELAVRLIADWGSNRPDMRRVPSQGACRGERSDRELGAPDDRLKFLGSGAQLDPVVSHAATEPGPEDGTRAAPAGRGRIR